MQNRGCAIFILGRKVLLCVFLLLLVFLVSACFPGQALDDSVYFVIKGDSIESEKQVTLNDLKNMTEGIIEAQYFSINSYGTREYTNFKGVWVWYILQESVELPAGAARVSFVAEDGYTVEYSLEEVKRDNYINEENPADKYKMIIAWEEEGEKFDLTKGNPFQLVVGQREPGDVNKPYWVRNIETIIIH